MNANRLVVRLYSVVAILAAMIYLSGIAMAQPPKKDNKHDGNQPVPEHDSFDNDGSDTFENSPTPTFTPEPPRPEKKNDKEKEQKEKKEKKDKDDGVVTIQSALPDLKFSSVVVTPVGDVAGGSGVTGQAATITVTILNGGSGSAGEFRLDVWKHLPSPPNFGSIGDFSQTFAGLAGNTSLSVSYSFSMANSYGTYFPRSTVDSGSLVVETSEANNTNTGSYTLIEMATVVPPTINTVSGASVVFRGVAKNYGKKWPVNQPSAIITVPGVGTVTVPHNGTATLAGVGTFGPIVKNLIGDASLTCALAEGFGGTATVTFVCGTSTASGQLRSVCLGAITPSGTIIAAGKSLTFTVQTNPASSTWPSGAPTATLSPPEAGTLSPVGTTTGSATTTFHSHGTFGGVATISINYGSCSSSATVTVARIEFTDIEGNPVGFVGAVSGGLLRGIVGGTFMFSSGGGDLPPSDLFRVKIYGLAADGFSGSITISSNFPDLGTATLVNDGNGNLISEDPWALYTDASLLSEDEKAALFAATGIKAVHNQTLSISGQVVSSSGPPAIPLPNLTIPTSKATLKSSTTDTASVDNAKRTEFISLAIPSGEDRLGARPRCNFVNVSPPNQRVDVIIGWGVEVVGDLISGQVKLTTGDVTFRQDIGRVLFSEIAGVGTRSSGTLTWRSPDINPFWLDGAPLVGGNPKNVYYLDAPGFSVLGVGIATITTGTGTTVLNSYTTGTILRYRANFESSFYDSPVLGRLIGKVVPWHMAMSIEKTGNDDIGQGVVTNIDTPTSRATVTMTSWNWSGTQTWSAGQWTSGDEYSLVVIHAGTVSFGGNIIGGTDTGKSFPIIANGTNTVTVSGTTLSGTLPGAIFGIIGKNTWTLQGSFTPPDNSTAISPGGATINLTRDMK